MKHRYMILVIAATILLVGCATQVNSSLGAPSEQSKSASAHTQVRPNTVVDDIVEPPVSNVHPGPAPLLVDFAILPAKETYSAGDLVRLTVRFRNVSQDQMILDSEVPKVFISPMAAGYDSAHPTGDALALPWLAGRAIAPGEEVSGEVVWQQHGSSGWYRTSLGIVQFQAGKVQATTGGGGGQSFLVAYPAGSVLVRTLEPNAQVTHDGLTLSIRRVDFTERETKVSFHVTNLKAPAEFGLKLVRPDGEEGPVLGLSHKDSAEGGIDGWAEYNPTLATADYIDLELAASTGHNSPWRVRIPLKESDRTGP